MDYPATHDYDETLETERAWHAIYIEGAIVLLQSNGEFAGNNKYFL